MLTRSEIPNLLKAGLQIIFEDAYGNAASEWERIATRIDSTRDVETYGWLGASPRLREFADERLISRLRENAFTIRNRTWESTVAVERAAVEDEQYGQIRLRVEEMARDAKRHPDELVFELLAGGFTALGYDGRPFFDTAHEEGDSGAQANAGSDPLSSVGLRNAVTAMRRIKDDRGRPMGIEPDTLVVPPELEWTARELLSSAFYPDALAPASASQRLAANPLQGALRLIVSPYLSDADDWFLLQTSRPVRPVIVQVRIEPEFEALEGESAEGFLRDRWLYGVRARHAAGYGPWQYAYGSLV